MDSRMKILEEIQKKKEQIEIAKKSDKLMVEGGTDSEPAVAIIRNNGNATRQLYHALGSETLQSHYGNEEPAELTELSEQQSLSYHNNDRMM